MILLAVISIIILIYSAILHEIAHGFVAQRLGDPTARLMGRLTLNPVPHVDPIMSILLPLILYISSHGTFVFGAAKPVPIDPFNFRDGRKDVALVSLAGPATNFLIAITGAVLAHVLYPGLSIDTFIAQDILGYILGYTIFINLILGFFNLVPIPPLDGSKVLALVLPEDLASQYLSLGNIGIFIIMFLILFPVGGFSLWEIVQNLIIFSEHLLGL